MDLISLIIEASRDIEDVIWEPFGGLFTAAIAAKNLGRKVFGSEIDWIYFFYSVQRTKE